MSGTIGPDFLMVHLTPAGAAFANGSPLRVSNGRTSLVFSAGTPLKVARYEWDMLLRTHCSPTGKPLFAVMPSPTPEEEALVHQFEVQAPEEKE